MENIFENVKERVQIERVCELLGINLNRSHKALCPFPEHNEKTPSFSVSPSKNIFYCFGCGKKGDSITLVSEMLNVKPFEAVVFLNNNLGLGIEFANRRVNKDVINKYREKNIAFGNLKKWELETFVKLTDEYHKLKEYEKKKSEEYRDNPEEYFEDEKIVKYLQNKDIIEEIIDEMLELTDDKEILKFKKLKGKVVKLLNG